MSSDVQTPSEHVHSYHAVSLPCTAGTFTISIFIVFTASHVCRSSVILSIIELLEEAGLPPLCIAVVEEADAESITGDLFAAAIKVTLQNETRNQSTYK